MSSSDTTTVVGLFPDKSRAEHARRSLREHGIPSDSISTIGPRKAKPVDIREKIELSLFSEEQLQLFAREHAQGRSIVLVEVSGPAEDVVALLNASDALHVEVSGTAGEGEWRRTLPLYEEQLRVDKEARAIGDIVIRKVIEEVSAQAEAEASHEELDVEHTYVGKVVSERRGPWREGDVLVIPVYEEQLTVVRQLVMREQLRVSLHQVSEKHILADTVRRERVVVEDPDQTRRVNVRRQGPLDSTNNEPSTPGEADTHR